MSEISIKVSIAGREYPLRVNSNDQAVVLKAQQEIQDKINELQTNYGVRDKQDLLAMTLIQIMIQGNKQESTSEPQLSDGVLDKLQDLEQFVSDYLKAK